MRVTTIIAALAIMLVGPACAQEQAGEMPENLAPNVGFEEGEGDAPDGWSHYSWQDSRGWWDDQQAHSGERSLGLEGPNGGWSATLSVEPGIIYNMRFHYRAGEVPCRFVVYVRYPGEGKAMTNLIYKPMLAVPHTQRGEFVDGALVGGTDERGWALAEVGDFVAPEGVTEIMTLIKLTSKQEGARGWLDDLLITASEPRQIPDTARVLRRVDGAVVWTDNENRKILRDRQPPDGETSAAIEIAAARGEFESFQIAVTPATDMSAVNWTCSAVKGPAPMPEDAVRCRRVEYVDIQKTTGPFGYQGLNPDALTDQLPCDIEAGANQPFWFTVHVPKGQTPGEYEAMLTLTSGDNVVCEAPLRLRVRSFQLPPRATLDVRSSGRWNLVLAKESGEDSEVLTRYYRDFHEHRTRCAPHARVTAEVNGDQAEVEMDDYIEAVRLMHDEWGARRFNVPSLWIGHRGTHEMPPDAQWQSIPIFANAELTDLNPAFEKPFRDYMGQLVRRLKDEGLFLEPTVRFIDEPNLSHEQTVNGIRALSLMFRDIDPDLRIAETCSYPHPDLMDVTDVWVLHTDGWDQNAARIARAKEAGCAISVYNNAVNLPDHKPIRVRLWPWLLKKYEVDGTYSWWGSVCWRGDSEDPWNSGAGNSGVMLYPPRDDSEYGPIDSVRWELFREGLEDFEYMSIAENLAKQLEAAGNPNVARQGRAAVAAALELVERWPNVRAANDEPYTLDVTQVDAAREALATAIEAMQAEL